MEFTRRIELDTSYADAIAAVKEALKDQGFGVLAEIDVRQTLKDKLDVDVEAQISSVPAIHSSPTALWRSTPGSPRCCRATSLSAPNRDARSSSLDPKIIAQVADNPALGPIAHEAGQRIQAALDVLGSA